MQNHESSPTSDHVGRSPIGGCLMLTPKIVVVMLTIVVIVAIVVVVFVVAVIFVPLKRVEGRWAVGCGVHGQSRHDFA